jgi:DNA-binding transcriptional regulator YiaG
MEELNEIVNGTLLGDACIQFDNYKYKKYFSYKLSAKDRNFLEWVKLRIKNLGIRNLWISLENKNPIKFALYFYINSCSYKHLLKLREKWYILHNGKSAKIVPRDINLTPMVLLHWYLGDGCLVRRRGDQNRVPYIVLATNTFSKEDVDFLIRKLKEHDLNFYPVRYKSGFTGKGCGYCLYSKTEDGTPFRFFKLIGECPKKIADCTTGSKGIYHEIKFFKDKWPTKDDWTKILSNVKGIGKILRERREIIGISKKRLIKLLGVNKDYVRKIESGRRRPSVNKLRQIMKALDLNSLEIS